MNKKIIVYFIIILVLVSGGFFYSLKTTGILSNNRFLAAVAGFFSLGQAEKKNFSLPEEQFLVLGQKIAFLQESLDAKEEELENLDDLIEKFDVLSQKITELEAQTQTFADKISEISTQEELDQDEELDEELEELTEEIGQGIGQKLCEINLSTQPPRNKIIINEVAWMGTANSANNEWIELKNISGQEVNLNGWQLFDKDNQIKIIFGLQPRVLASNGFLLLERTSDNSAPGIAADLIYAGTLSNTNEALYLFDDNCRLQDMVLANPDWPGGDNSSKRTMERKDNFSWQTSLNPAGTPKVKNSRGYIVVPAGGGAPPPPKSSYSKVLISEIQILPIEERFIELYNPNKSSVVLTDWYLQRKTKTGADWNSLVSSTKFEGKIIQPQNHFLIAKTNENVDIVLDLTLTEDNSLALKNPNGEIVDKIGWGQAQDFETAAAENPASGNSIGRKWSESKEDYLDTENNSADFEIQTASPKEKNKPKTNQPPIAVFTFSPENPFIDEEIIFDAASSTDPDGQIISYIWDFGDDNSITIDQATTTHLYATSTDFTIGLQVIDNEGAVSALATSTIFVAEIEAPFSELDVVINEIAWMGTGADSVNDEWIELFNNTNQEIDLTGWQIFENGGQTLIIALERKIGPQDYYLIERGEDDNTISDILADVYGPFGGNGLLNSGEHLVLKDNTGKIIDEVNFSSDSCGKLVCWPAGKASPDYISMERINSNIVGSDSANWANNNLILRNGLNRTNNPINGTPKTQNSVYQQP